MSVSDIVQEYITKWYVVIPTLFVVYQVVDFFYVRSLRSRLGAKAPTNNESDGYWGSIYHSCWFQKAEGTIIDFAGERFKSIAHPEVPTFQFPIFTVKVISTVDPENIKAVLATQFNDFSLGTRHNQFAPLLGDGIFTLDGAGWKHSRSMLRPQFAREQVAHVKALEPHMQVLFKHIRKSGGRTFDLQELFSDLLLILLLSFIW